MDESIRIKLSLMIEAGRTHLVGSEIIAQELIKKAEELNIQLKFPKGLIKYMTEHDDVSYSITKN